MTGVNRLQKKGAGSGRKLKRAKKNGAYDRDNYQQLGGIPMKIINGKIRYAKKVPNGYWYDKHRHTYTDATEIERRNAPTPDEEDEGNFIRKHIYEMRFDIKADGEETDNGRRKRKYKEWWENRKI